MSTRRRAELWALIVLPLLIMVGVGLGAWQVWQHYTTDAALRWTALGALATVGAFLAAIFGVPLALWQLFEVRRKAALAPQVHADEASVLEQIGAGTSIARMFQDARKKDNELSRALELAALNDFPEWVDATAGLVGAIAGNDEAAAFRLQGKDGKVRSQLDAKLAYLREQFQPKVRAGYWIELAAARPRQPRAGEPLPRRRFRLRSKRSDS